MQDVIDMLLQKQSTLEAEKEAEKAAAVERIESDYTARAEKITALLDLAGYVPPVVEDVGEQPAEDAADAADIVDPCGQVY